MVSFVHMSVLGEYQESVEISGKPTVVGHGKNRPLVGSERSLEGLR